MTITSFYTTVQKSGVSTIKKKCNTLIQEGCIKLNKSDMFQIIMLFFSFHQRILKKNHVFFTKVNDDNNKCLSAYYGLFTPRTI